jgi:uncharacterized RDD family membrane protein YckC
MSELLVETPEGVCLRFEIAGAGTRLLAAAVDGLLWVLGMSALALFLGLIGLGPGTALLAGGAVLLLVLYSFLFPVLWNGRTPGKVVMGIRTSDEQGFPARAAQHFLRSLFVPFEAIITVPIPLVWILIAATPRHQRLGDLVAGTLVLRERGARAPAEPVPRARWSTLERRTLALEPSTARAFDGRDLGFLRQLLSRTDLEPEARDRQLVRAGRHCPALRPRRDGARLRRGRATAARAVLVPARGRARAPARHARAARVGEGSSGRLILAAEGFQPADRVRRRSRA